MTVSSLVMAAATVAILFTMERAAPGNGVTAQAIRLGVTIGGSLAALAVMATLLQVDAVGNAVEMVYSRVRKLLRQ